MGRWRDSTHHSPTPRDNLFTYSIKFSSTLLHVSVLLWIDRLRHGVLEIDVYSIWHQPYACVQVIDSCTGGYGHLFCLFS